MSANQLNCHRITRLPLADIRRRYLVEDRPLDAATEEVLRADPRAGAQAILDAVARRRFKNRSEGQRLRKLLRYESAVWATGVLCVAGVDEAGMSPLAGPVAAAAVVFAPGSRIPGVDDSKKLDASTRNRLAAEIRRQQRGGRLLSLRWTRSTPLTFTGRVCSRCTAQSNDFRSHPSTFLVDARYLRTLNIPQQSIVKGELQSLTIAAASILAKTARDAVMHRLDTKHPDYGFAKHKGYPVRDHLAALKRFGASPVHRRSFAPVREALGLPPLPPWPIPEAR